MLCLCQYRPALLRFWFQTDLRRKNSASFFKIQAGKTFSYHGHVLVTLHVQFLCSDWLKFDLSSCVKFMQHLESCLLWQLKLTEFCVNLWCFLLPISTGLYKMKYSCYQESSVINGLFIGFLVEKCVACQSRKSDFGWHRFRFSPCLMRKRGFKILSDSGLTWYLSGAASRMVSLSNYCIWCLFFLYVSNFMRSSTVSVASLCTFVRFETMIWSRIRFDISLHCLQNFKKPLDIFSHRK